MKNKTVETVNVPMYAFKRLTENPRNYQLLATYIRLLRAVNRPCAGNPPKIDIDEHLGLYDWDESSIPKTMLLHDLECLSELCLLMFTLHRDKETGEDYIEVLFLNGFDIPAESEENE